MSGSPRNLTEHAKSTQATMRLGQSLNTAGTAACRCRGGFRGSSLGSLVPPFLKLATYKQTLTELADTHSSSLELGSAVQSRQTQECVPHPLNGSLGVWF